MLLLLMFFSWIDFTICYDFSILFIVAYYKQYFVKGSFLSAMWYNL